MHQFTGTIIRIIVGGGTFPDNKFTGVVKHIQFGIFPDLEHYRFLYRAHPWLAILLPKRWYVDAEKFYLTRVNGISNPLITTFIRRPF
uniref:hypothetical protein n=1 Tax=Okeania sp. SIO2F4 TaxID=2607790 RepID=UPI0025E6CEBE|nr:hypothetical protein [Okeania sp. SIO2F4]